MAEFLSRGVKWFNLGNMTRELLLRCGITLLTASAERVVENSSPGLLR